jgi:hypothetical protein
MELDLCNCVAMGIDHFDSALKAIFGQRSQKSRINTAASKGKTAYAAVGLTDAFNEALDAMRFCLTIRNRYAHSQFYDDASGRLALVTPEELAKNPTEIKDLSGLTVKHLTEPVLRKQEKYFLYTRACIEFVNYEGRFLRGNISTRLFNAPAKLARPAEFAEHANCTR